ncbi:MAG: glycosyltransferase [Candidatus Diapherotrites archaeon]|nr:glycosyltransferase [Candidatus Diapherotrites archaeon]
MHLRGKTIFVFGLFVLISVLGVLLSITPWMVLFLSLIFLSVASVFIFVYEDFSDKLVLGNKKISYPSLSVLIPCYNASASILQCVQAIKNMDYPQPFEVIVIDDGSKDNSVALVKTVSGVRVIVKEKNSGKANCLNLGLKEAQGELVVCIDADTYPEKDCLMKMVPLFESEKVGAVTALIKPYKPSNLLQRIQSIEYLVGFGFYQSMLSVMDAAFVTPGPMCVYRKKYLLEIGGYDEQNITEDMDIALNLQKHHYQIKACHYATVYTEVPVTLSHWIKQRLRWYRGKIFNTKKYKDLLFNKEYGHLGRFTLPFTFLLELASVLSIFIVLANLADVLFYAGNVFFIGLSVGVGPKLELPKIIINSSTVLFYLIMLFIFSVNLYLAFKVSRQKLSLSQFPVMLVLIMAYTTAVALIWMYSLFLELNHAKKVWL